MEKNKSTAIIAGSINLSAIDKTKIVEGKDGAKYLNFTAIVKSQSRFNNNVWVTQSQTKEEREAQAPKVSLGNAAVKWVSDTGIHVANREEVTNTQQNQAREEKPF